MSAAAVLESREVLSSNPSAPEMIKGKMIVSHVNWVRERMNPIQPRHADLTALWNAMPVATARRLAASIDPAGWYLFEDVVLLDRAIVKLFGTGKTSVLDALGRYSADKNVPADAIIGDVHRYMNLHAVLHSRFQNFGVCTYSPLPHGGRMDITNYTAYSPVYCSSGTGFFTRILERFGKSNVKVTEPQCHCRGDERCRVEMRWR